MYFLFWAEENEDDTGEGTPVIAYASRGLPNVMRRRLRRSPLRRVDSVVSTPVASTIQFVGNPSPVAPGSTATFTLERNGPITGTTVVNVAITGGTASSGFGSLSASTLTWEANDADDKTITLTTTNDNTSIDETVIVTVSPVSNAEIGANSTATLTIYGKSLLTWESSTATVTAGNTLSINVNRTGTLSRTAAVGVSAIAGTADTSDYGTPSPTTINWAADDGAPKTVTVSTVSDADPSQSFVLRISGPTNAVMLSGTDCTVTITPPYHADVQNYITNLTAKGVARTTTELDAFNTWVNGAIAAGWYSSLIDACFFQCAGDGALLIASTKLKAYSAIGNANITFNNSTDARFSKTLGFSPIAGAGGSSFNTKVPQDLGVSGTTGSANRALAVWPTDVVSANFAAWLSASNASNANPWHLRVADPAASALSIEFPGGSLQATGQSPYTGRIILSTINSSRNVALYNGVTRVGSTSVTTTAVAPGTAQIGGSSYWTASSPGDSYANPNALSFIFNADVRSHVSSIQTLTASLVSSLAA